jgi:hypothetical protein
MAKKIHQPTLFTLFFAMYANLSLEGKHSYSEIPKGQLISKCRLGIFILPKDEQKNSTLLLVELFLFFGRKDISKLTDL